MKYLALLAVTFAVAGCARLHYKSPEIRATAKGDLRIYLRSENTTDADDIAPQVKAQIAEKLQGADQIKLGGANK